MSNEFYVYVLLDPRKPGEYKYGEFVFPYEPFYVGKGKNGRAGEHFQIRNQSDDHKSRKIRKIYKETGLEPIIAKPYENLFEEVSFELEKFLIAQIGRYDLGKGPLTNYTDGGEGTSGYIFTEETRKKMSEAKLGKTLSEEHKRKLSEANKGKTLSEEYRKKLSKSLKGKMVGKNHPMFGKTHSKESRRKMSESLKGRTLSEEHKRKLSESLKGHSVSEESRRKLSKANIGEKNPMFGKTLSEETKKRMSEAHKKRHAFNKLKNRMEELINLVDQIPA